MSSEMRRKTRETEVHVKLNLYGIGEVEVDVEPRFLKHMVETLARHAGFDLYLRARGDLRHHVVEDVAVCLGEALNKALGDRSGINRFGHAIVPMDECLAYASVDLVRRPWVRVDLKLSSEMVEDVAASEITHFLETLVKSMEATVHLWVEYGTDDHHKVEAAFKALAVALRQAVSKRRGLVPSVKGVV